MIIYMGTVTRGPTPDLDAESCRTSASSHPEDAVQRYVAYRNEVSVVPWRGANVRAEKVHLERIP